MKAALIMFGLCIGALPVAGQMQQREAPFPEEARSRLNYAIGIWDSKTESLDRDGNVIKTTHSESERKFVIEDRVVEIAGVLKESGKTFRAWEYYDVESGKYTLTSIDRKGRLFTMSGDLGEEFQWTSEPQKRPDGSSFAMRFTHYDIEPDSFTALGEISRDGGKTWRAFTRQSMTRRSE